MFALCRLHCTSPLRASVPCGRQNYKSVRSSRDFLEILQELTPEAVDQAKKIGGVRDEDAGGGGDGGSW